MMQFNEFYYQDKRDFLTEVHQLLEDVFQSEEIDPMFISRLINYLEKSFPSYGDLNSSVSVELRKIVKGDNKQILKIKKKILDIINKSKTKFLDGVDRKCSNIKLGSVQKTSNGLDFAKPQQGA